MHVWYEKLFKPIRNVNASDQTGVNIHMPSMQLCLTWDHNLFHITLQSNLPDQMRFCPHGGAHKGSLLLNSSDYSKARSLVSVLLFGVI